MSPLHLDNISFDKENIHGVFNLHTSIGWLALCIMLEEVRIQEEMTII